MKKITLILATFFVAGTVMSQDLTSKKGEVYLPEAGDYAIGVDASPFLNYFGNFIGGNGANVAPTFNSHPLIQGAGPVGHTISFKMFEDAQTAYRGNVRIGFNSNNTKMMVGDITDPGEFVEDEVKTSQLGVTLGAGLEKRRGNTRLQGVYGAQGQIGFASALKTTNTFGNDIDDFAPGTTRTTEMKTGSSFTFGVGAFVGAEYFVAPKMSIGGEYLWGILIASTGAGEATTETSDDDDVTFETGGSTGSFNIDTATLGSFNLMLNFHF